MIHLNFMWKQASIWSNTVTFLNARWSESPMDSSYDYKPEWSEYNPGPVKPGYRTVHFSSLETAFHISNNVFYHEQLKTIVLPSMYLMYVISA